MEKYYIVEDTCASGIGDYDNIVLVKANNAVEALNQMWLSLGYDDQSEDVKKGYKPHYKKEFLVRNIDDYFEDNLYGNEHKCVIIH